jgi:hypothetical protein
MDHEIHRVVSFEKVAPFTLQVRFEHGVSQVIDFRPALKGEYTNHCRIRRSLTEFGSIPRSTRWSGQTAPILIRQRFTTGRSSLPPEGTG